jgi:dTMP kinase
VTGGLKPDLTFFVDVAVDEGLQRRKEGYSRGEEWNRMDSLSREFYDRVRAGYKEMMREEPLRWVYIDGSDGIEAVQDELRLRMDLALDQFRRAHALRR